ncbi:hypothetical protein LNTAR_10146 [Lentisphaera araneosa HTCC2155]|uniref:Uncharacterized protein n=1 Tax=Lentisphaera araneosa HTCC2155 TaxID=313628 RepID=A6DII2_9BACT|nr:hypothetical protein [Lentisphaera araneosa]EDM28268.1 hypothetical protein LNTAR_10146 [Lentisphaera araneosa HTCC2155]
MAKANTEKVNEEQNEISVNEDVVVTQTEEKKYTETQTHQRCKNVCTILRYLDNDGKKLISSEFFWSQYGDEEGKMFDELLNNLLDVKDKIRAYTVNLKLLEIEKLTGVKIDPSTLQVK